MKGRNEREETVDTTGARRGKRRIERNMADGISRDPTDNCWIDELKQKESKINEVEDKNKDSA